jgi:hypothetical protein
MLRAPNMPVKGDKRRVLGGLTLSTVVPGLSGFTTRQVLLLGGARIKAPRRQHMAMALLQRPGRLIPGAAVAVGAGEHQLVVLLRLSPRNLLLRKLQRRQHMLNRRGKGRMKGLMFCSA